MCRSSWAAGASDGSGDLEEEGEEGQGDSAVTEPNLQSDTVEFAQATEALLAEAQGQTDRLRTDRQNATDSYNETERSLNAIEEMIGRLEQVKAAAIAEQEQRSEQVRALEEEERREGWNIPWEEVHGAATRYQRPNSVEAPPTSDEVQNPSGTSLMFKSAGENQVQADQRRP
jgi:hypothetical protein